MSDDIVDSDFKQPSRYDFKKISCCESPDIDKGYCWVTIAGAIFLLYYLLVGMISYFTGKKGYDKVREEFPESEYTNIPKGIIAAHWCYFTFSFLFSFGLMLAPLINSSNIYAIPLGLGFIGGVISYIAYLAVYFTSKEYKFSANFVTYDQFLTNLGNQTKPVDAIISFEGKEYNPQNLGVSLSYCVLLPYENRFKAISNDGINISYPPLPERGTSFRVHTNYNITITPKSKTFLDNFIAEGMACIERNLVYNMSIKSIKKLKGELYYGFSKITDNYFVVKSLKETGFLKKSSKIASGIFAAGVYTAFKVRSFPSFELYVEQRNVDFKEREYGVCMYQYLRYRCLLTAPNHNDGSSAFY